jgi:hypothetical protein
VLKAEINERQATLAAIEAQMAIHEAALERGCERTCDHPLDSDSVLSWRAYHEMMLRNDQWLAEETRIDLWVLATDGAGKLETAMTDAENILRLPAGDEEQDYWRARHEAAHVVIGLVLGRTLGHVTLEPDAELHPDNQGSTVWIDDGPPPLNLDAVTTWAGVIAGPERSVAEGDLEHLEAIGGMYDNYRWGARRLYRRFERLVLELTEELLHRRAMTGAEAADWLRERTSRGPEGNPATGNAGPQL